MIDTAELRYYQKELNRSYNMVNQKEIESENQKEIIRNLTEKLKAQDGVLNGLNEQSLKQATIIASHDGKIILSGVGGYTETSMPAFPVEIGDRVCLTDKGQILRKAIEPIPSGRISTVARIINEHSCEVGGDTLNRVVLSGKQTPQIGDLVLLDPTETIIIGIIPADEKQKISKSTVSPIHWDDIGGQTEAKIALQEAVVFPQLYPDIFAFYDKRAPAGLLLYGPPGNGKTLLGRAVATALQDGGEGGFFPVKGPEVLDVYVGESERKLRSLFRAARQHKDETGKPGIIFIDEAEALLSRRGDRSTSGMEKTIVPTFLAETDGLEASSAIVILATNRPESLDEAVVREGRMDRKIEVKRPNVDETQAILAIHLRKLPLAEGAELEALTKDVTFEIFSANRTIEGGSKTLADIISGAMIAGLVEQAKSVALTRDIDAKADKPSGIRQIDLMAAIARAQEENRNIVHA